MNYRIVQVSSTKFGLERRKHSKRRKGWLWWRKTEHVAEWVPFGEHLNMNAYTRVGNWVLPGRIDRRYFNSEAEAQAFLDECRAQKDYPKVVKYPA